jgi:putative chitinase
VISTTQLIAICPHAGSRIATFIQPLNDAMDRFSIATPRRQAAFLAQCAHETGELKWLREMGPASYFAKYDTGVLAKQLGNTLDADDDGSTWRGRGGLMVTGLSNYKFCAAGTDIDCVAHPELLEQPGGACMSAAWFWKAHGLNEHADVNAFGTITHTINGGYTGLDSRLGYWLAALAATGAS